MNLIIDVGNTLVKSAVFKGNRILSEYKFDKKIFLSQVEKIFNAYPEIKYAIVSSVSNLLKKEIKALSVFCNVIKLNNKTKIPFKNKYATPKTLGADRIALITAGFYEFQKQNILVIDAGSCITFDFLSEDGEYFGGAISPGIKMRYKALNKFTDKLPLIESTKLDDFIGNSTKKCIISGVINGIINEIEGVINQYSTRFDDLTIILTGGDGDFLSKRLKSSIFANSIFLLKGLNYILELNKYE